LKLLTIAATALLLMACATRPPSPVIDVHLHSDWWGQPNLFEPLSGLTGEATADALRGKTLEQLRANNVVAAVTSGPELDSYVHDDAKRIVRALGFEDAEGFDEFRAKFAAGKYGVMAESMPQYAGFAPNDPGLEPFFAYAESIDVPVGLHVGLGPPGAAYHGFPKYRMANSNPLLLEEVLLRHPKLRLYVMHAGWPMLDNMIGLLHAHPQVYVDVAVIDWALPREEFYTYLRRLVGAGYGKRIMYGSDQMQWPAAIGRSIDAVRSAPFLSEEQKRDILYNNAVRFFGMKPRL
jgi:hypothetical protein